MIYCFDLDGTLCSVAKDYRKAKPLKKRIAIVNRLKDKGHTIYIDTARGTMSGKDWKMYTEKQLKKWGVKFDLLRVGVKLHADYFIDDKGQNDQEFFLC